MVVLAGDYEVEDASLIVSGVVDVLTKTELCQLYGADGGTESWIL